MKKSGCRMKVLSYWLNTRGIEDNFGLIMSQSQVHVSEMNTFLARFLKIQTLALGETCGTSGWLYSCGRVQWPSSELESVCFQTVGRLAGEPQKGGLRHHPALFWAEHGVSCLWICEWWLATQRRESRHLLSCNMSSLSWPTSSTR